MEILEQILVNYGPSITAVIGVIVSVLTTIKTVGRTINTLVGTNDKTMKTVQKKLDEVVQRDNEIHRENLALKKQMSELMEVISRVRKDENL